MNEIKNDINYIKTNFKKPFKKLSCALNTNPVIIFMISPKLAGRSTYIGYLTDLFPDKFKVIAVGDIVRNWQERIKNEKKEVKKDLKEIFGDDKNKAFKELSFSDVKNLVSNETIIKLIKIEILHSDKTHSIIMDGFPRSQGQLVWTTKLAKEISKSYKPMVIGIFTHDSILDQRFDSRLICPKCQKSGSMLTLVNGLPKYDKNSHQFYLECYNCGSKMEKKKTDTSLEDMSKRRIEDKKLAVALLNNFNKQGFFATEIITGIETKSFSGKDTELNPAYSLKVNKKGKVIKSKGVQIGIEKNGSGVYSFHPKKIVGDIISIISNEI